MSRAEVSFEAREARVTFDSTRVRPDQLVDAVNRLGFRAVVKRGPE